MRRTCDLVQMYSIQSLAPPRRESEGDRTKHCIDRQHLGLFFNATDEDSFSAVIIALDS